MQTIEIDFDVHKKIELERTGFDDSPNAALRRLLGLPEIAARDAPPTPTQGAAQGWRETGEGNHLILPNGTLLQMTYNGRTYEGAIERGVWVVGGQEYGSPSGAAEGVARTKRGGRAKLNGWIYWKAKRPGEREWTSVLDLSKAARAAYKAQAMATS